MVLMHSAKAPTIMLFFHSMAASDSECPAWVQSSHSSQEASAHPQTETASCDKIHPPKAWTTCGLLGPSPQKGRGGEWLDEDFEGRS